MADTTKEAKTLEHGTACRVPGRIANVFPMEDGTGKRGTWYRQDFKLEDAHGDIKVKWFSPPDIQTMSHLEGREVEVQGKVDIYRGEAKIKCSGEDAVKALDGSSLEGGAQQPAGPPARSKPGASGVAPPPTPLTDVEWLSWANEMAPKVQEVLENAVPGWSGASQSPQAAGAVIEMTASILMHLSNHAKDGKLLRTLGQELDYQAEEGLGKRGPEGDGDGEPVPF